MKHIIIYKKIWIIKKKQTIKKENWHTHEHCLRDYKLVQLFQREICQCTTKASKIWISSDLISLLEIYLQEIIMGTSLLAQWLRICLPMQGTWVQSLVQEDPTCCRATKPVLHNYWGCALEPASHNYRARMPRAHALQQEKPESTCTTTKSSPRSPQLEKARALQQRPNAAKNKINKFKKRNNYDFVKKFTYRDVHFYIM